MKAELFNLVLLGQYPVVPLVEPLGIWDLWVICSTIYFFVYFKREKFPDLFFSLKDSCQGTSVFCGARCQ